MEHSKSSKDRQRLAPTLALSAIVLLAAWMGHEGGGYFVGYWAPVAFLLAALTVVASIAGMFPGTRSSWSITALGLFVGYAAWTFASLLWSPNRGDAWIGAGQTLLYILAFGLAVALIASGASSRWVLAASVIGPAVVAAFTLSTLVDNLDALFVNSRLTGTVGYYNGEAEFLLVPFWSQSTSPAPGA